MNFAPNLKRKSSCRRGKFGPSRQHEHRSIPSMTQGFLGALAKASALARGTKEWKLVYESEMFKKVWQVWWARVQPMPPERPQYPAVIQAPGVPRASSALHANEATQSPGFPARARALRKTFGGFHREMKIQEAISNELSSTFSHTGQELRNGLYTGSAQGVCLCSFFAVSRRARARARVRARARARAVRFHSCRPGPPWPIAAEVQGVAAMCIEEENFRGCPFRTESSSAHQAQGEARWESSASPQCNARTQASRPATERAYLVVLNARHCLHLLACLLTRLTSLEACGRHPGKSPLSLGQKRPLGPRRVANSQALREIGRAGRIPIYWLVCVLRMPLSMGRRRSIHSHASPVLWRVLALR